MYILSNTNIEIEWYKTKICLFKNKAEHTSARKKIGKITVGEYVLVRIEIPKIAGYVNDKKYTLNFAFVFLEK